MSVKVLHVVIFILMSGVTFSLPLEAETRHRRAEDACKECPAGTYMRDCKCLSCPDNTFTTKINKEDSCLQCFMDCRPELHLQVVTPCSKVADVVCECMKGFVCNKIDKYTGQCTRCKHQPPVQTTSQPPTQTFPHIAKTVSILHPSAGTTRTVTSTAQIKKSSWGQKILLSTLLLVLCILFSIITFCFYKQRKMDCLKKRLKQCSVRKKKEDLKTVASEINEPIKHLDAQDTHTQTPTATNTDCPTPQAAIREQSLPASGNLGPLHIYGAGTVFVSLLNQFGMNGGDKDEEDHRQQPLNNSDMHSPTSPTIPLSTEERDQDISYISFPSQEQGKECHMSKEEGL